ncbi:peptidase [Streptomyces eurythermus]|uniref:peptidase n=1 Tax=Streptomyces eurythermus TaxID=42237 RepID=UPI0033C7D207
MPKQAAGYAPDADAAADRAAQDTAAAEESAAQAEFSADYARNSAYQAAEARDRAQADALAAQRHPEVRGVHRGRRHRRDPRPDLRPLRPVRTRRPPPERRGARDLTAPDLLTLLDRGRLVMASVHKEIRRPENPAPGKYGHLVLVTGRQGDTVHFRNPSGHTAPACNASLPVAQFAELFGGRGVSLT